VHWGPDWQIVGEGPGRSVASSTEILPPLPSQTIFWQSPALWPAVTCVMSSFCVPHAPLVQVAAMHSLPVAGPSVGALQATQVPVALQTEPPLSVQVVPGVALPVPQVLEVQVLVLHFEACAGQSVGALQATQVPLPSQTEPPLSVQVVVSGALPVPQQPESHVLTLH